MRASLLLALIAGSGLTVVTGCGSAPPDNDDGRKPETDAGGGGGGGLDAGGDAGHDAGYSGWCTESDLDAICLVESGFVHGVSSLPDGGIRASLIGSVAEQSVVLSFDLINGTATNARFTYGERLCASPLCGVKCEYTQSPSVAAQLGSARLEGTFVTTPQPATKSVDGGCPSRGFTSRFGFAR